MGISVLIYVLLTLEVSEATSTVTYVGARTVIVCPLDDIYVLPTWNAPYNDTLIVYTQQGSAEFNPKLGEKLSRLSYADNQQDLVLINTRINDSGVYQCIWNNSQFVGDNTLYVRIIPNQPEITSSVQVNNRSVRATEGQSSTVTCTSRGGYPVPTVAWYRGSPLGNPLVQTSLGTQFGETYTVTLQYTFTPTRQDDRQQLVCRSYWPIPADAPGSLDETVLLFLYLKPIQLSVTQKTSVVAGNDVIAECRTSGSRPEPSVYWTYLGMTYTSTSTVTNESSNQTFSTVSVLERPVTVADNGQVMVCKVSHRALDENLTASALLNIQFPVGPSTTNISGNRVIVANGANQLSLVCTTGSSNPPAVITWRNETELIPNNNAYTNTTGDNSGVVMSQALLIIATRYDNGKKISCFATNDINQITDNTSVTLNVQFTPIVTISTTPSITLTEKHYQPPTVLPCRADSNPPATIMWYHNGRAVTRGNTSSSLSYSIMEANRTNNGNYTCTADNNVPPGDSKSYTVNVLFRPLKVIIDKPSIYVNANGQNQMAITCTSGSSNPVSEIIWHTGIIQISTPSHDDSPGLYGGIERTSTIRFYPMRDHDGATISCEARNNVTGQNVVKSTTVIDNIIYHPLIADMPAINVTEGGIVTLPCHASSKPPANFTWSIDSVKVANGSGTVTYNGLNYTIHNTSRTKAGTYTCIADNKVQSNDTKHVLLTVLYPPDITVNAINKTFNSSGTTVTCEASGVPDQYKYESWEHAWNGHVVKHPNPLPAIKVLTLTNLSYAHSGVYTCGASNGVGNVSYGAGSLLVKSPPIVVGDVANVMEIKASGQLMKEIVVTFRYYSNAGRGYVTVQKTNDTRWDLKDVKLRDVNITLPVFLSEINTSGTEAIIPIAVTNMSQFGSYAIFVTNDIGSVQLSLILQPLGPPEPPTLINITVLDHHSVTILWISGFPNGLNQTFIIQLSTDNTTWRNITQYGGMAYLQMQNRIIDTLTGSQLYFVRILAFNAEGESELSSTLSFITAASPDTFATPPVALISGGASGGVVAAAVVIAVIIVVVRRRKPASMTGGANKKGAIVMSSIQNEGYDNGDEEVINRLYESADVTETAASKIKQLPPTDAEKLYAKVNKSAEVVYAMPDKRKAGKKKKDKHDKNKTQTGDVYENTTSFMSGNKSAQQSVEGVYEDTSISATTASKKPTGTEGLLYADLEFAPKKKGPAKIIGIEDRCEYTTIDLTKKAQPLPDSDDEDKKYT